MNLTKSSRLIRSHSKLRFMSTNQEKKKDDKLAEATSYEKWLKNAGNDAKSRLDHYKELMSNWTKGRQGASEEWYAERVSFWMKRYENYIGLTEVKAAQALVVKEEKLFSDAQERRRDTQNLINDIQTQLKSIRTELERTSRAEDRYLELVTQEHQVIKEENSLVNQLHNLERLEREKFSRLSRAVRDSHEKERAQAEKNKYWSILGSVIGTGLGILGTTINNRYRMKELRNIVTDATQVNNLQDSDQNLDQKSIANWTDQQNQLEVLNENFLKIMETFHLQLDSIEKLIQNQPKAQKIELPKMPKIDLSQDFKELSNLLAKNNSIAIESLGKILTLRDEKFLQSLKNSNSDSYNSFSSRVCDIEEKVKDIRSLVLSQTMSNSDSLITSSVKNRQAEKSNLSNLRTVELSLKDHEERIERALIVSGCVLAVLVPIASYALTKLF